MIKFLLGFTVGIAVSKPVRNKLGDKLQFSSVPVSISGVLYTLADRLSDHNINKKDK